MKKLYKYYSSNLKLDTYLKEPTIKISQLQHLNDPFEGFITGDVLTELINKVHPILSPNKEKTFSDIRAAKRHIRRQIDCIGITSLSETSRNLLMWSHYASEHKGVCIGYKIPLITPHKSNSIEPPELRKVNYDSLLFDHEHIDLLKETNTDTDEIFAQIAERILTTKSEGWSYEKEHRYITQIEQCDIVRYFKNRTSMPKYIESAINKATEEKSHAVEEKYSYIDLVSKRTIKQLVHSINDPQSIEMKLKQSKDVAFLKKIPIKSIDSIYFGVNHPISEIEDIISLKSTDKKYEHINLYHYELSKDRYEIVPYPLS